MKYRYALALAIAISTTACSKSGAELKPEEVFATVNGEQISTKEFDAFVSAVSNGSVTSDKLTPEQRKQLTDRLLGMHVAAAEASKAGLDKQGEAAVQLNLWRANILSDAMVKQQIEKSPVTDAEIEAEYNSQIAAMPKEYKASHILVKTKEEADALLTQLKAGKDFAELAKKNSQDPGSAKNGGDLGWFAPTSMVKEFGDAVAKLNKGQLTDTPVQTQYGFHIIKLEDSRTPTPPALADVKPQVSNIVKNKKVEKYLEDLRKTAKIELNAHAASSSASSTSSAGSDAKP